MIPARDTVAGEAYFNEPISKIMRIAGRNGIRSFEANVKILLSSITVFIDSIHSASISPSKTKNFGIYGESGMSAIERIIVDKIPSFHSRVAYEI